MSLVRLQLWLWFVGMIVTTFPWHYVGILGMPRRMAYYDYSNPALANEAAPVAMSAIGGFILLTSGLLFLFILVRSHFENRVDPGQYTYSQAAHTVTRVPAALNGHGLWVALMVALTITNYGLPIMQLAVRDDTSVPAVFVGERR
jgi:cytochrome c oxidase subunit 1